VLSSTQRFGVEFLRLNPRVAVGLTEAQLIAAALGLVGLAGLVDPHLHSTQDRAATA